MPYRRTTLLALCLIPALLAGCVRVHVDPIVATINVNVKIDRQLDDFFAYQNPPPTAPQAGSTAGQPAVVVPPPTTIPVRQ